MNATDILKEITRRNQGIARNPVLKERKEALLAQVLATTFGKIDATPRVDAPRLSVPKKPKAPYVNHRARYHRLGKP